MPQRLTPYRRACAKPDLPPGRAFGDVARQMRDVVAVEQNALNHPLECPPEVGLGARAPLAPQEARP